MNTRLAAAPVTLAACLAALVADPAFAAEETLVREEEEAVAEQPASPPPSPPPGFAIPKPVFDETWATVGLGLGMVPSYAGSDNYIAFPLPLIVGRVGGIGISPNGPGFVLDLNSPKPGLAPRTKPRLAFGPAIRFRNDRADRISDPVVERAGLLDAALEVGVNVGVTIPGVFRRFDQVTLGVQVRRDILGAHEGTIIEPQIGYRAVLGRAFTLQAQASLEFVDNSFANYYFTVSPAQSAATGLARYTADGGLNRVGTLAILAYDLDGNSLNGGWSLTGIGGASRLIGDSARTPYTTVRGQPEQFILGLGVAYTF